MPNRYLLALSKLDEFAAWATTKGYQREKTKGRYEVLRLRKLGEKPRLYFRRDVGGHVHATCQAGAVGLVRQWLRERENA
jgi:hypothetical protein